MPAHLRNASRAAREVPQRARRRDWLAWAGRALDGAVRGITAGLSPVEIRAMLRGDAPTEKPNPPCWPDASPGEPTLDAAVTC